MRKKFTEKLQNMSLTELNDYERQHIEKRKIHEEILKQNKHFLMPASFITAAVLAFWGSSFLMSSQSIKSNSINMKNDLANTYRTQIVQKYGENSQEYQHLSSLSNDEIFKIVENDENFKETTRRIASAEHSHKTRVGIGTGFETAGGLTCVVGAGILLGTSAVVKKDKKIEEEICKEYDRRK